MDIDPAAPAVTETPAADPQQGGNEPGAEPAATPAASSPGASTDGAPPTGEAAKPADGQPDPAKPAEPPRANLTARLADLSKKEREARTAAKQAEARAKAAEAKAADLDALLTKAKDDPSIIPTLFERAGLSFEKVVNFYAEQGKELSPEEQQAKAIADLRKELDEAKVARETEAKAAKQRAEENATSERIAGVAETIKKNAEKFEICARLGDEAARDVFAEVASAWNKAGKPDLMPGEYEEAVDAAIELVELRYEERGRKLQKQPKGAATTTTPANGTPANKLSTELPADIAGGKMSDKDEDILKGLIDKTAPGGSSSRAKPRTISSSLGGSAPPKTPARGSMDPRDALRDVLAPFQRQ